MGIILNASKSKEIVDRPKR
ncbi:hypothetical protein CCACVL1_23285 [Corchorus capsularis]|uniref:Uncharacterized protein n=1 Tax=Corchorus capsularis TaxID=210143 RepID=A0A1R3GUJ0_COCAP|nr:hypothetical protein CCACVL1_23285 [Corchorus capsularis]